MHSYVKLLVLCLLAIFAAQASATHNDKIVVEEEVDWCKAKCSGDKECRANKVECLAAKAEEEAAKAEEEADKNTDWCKKKCSGDKDCRAKKAECLAQKAEEEAAKAEEEAEEADKNTDWCKAKCSGDKDCRAKKEECLADKNTDWCKEKCGGDKACKAKKEACKKAKEEAAKKEEEDKKNEEKEEGGQKPKPTGKTDAYGIPVTKKSGMNRACRATWTCGASQCIGVDDKWLSSCKGGKNCQKDLASWNAAAFKAQWGLTASHLKAVYNLQQPKNCANWLKQEPALVKDIESCIKSFGQSGSNYKVNYKNLCDVISKTCTVTDYGVNTVGFPKRTMIISVADQNKCKQSGVESCKSYHRALCINGKVHDGFISTKQH